MPFAVEVVEEDRLVRVRLYGASNVEEARAAVAAIKARVGTYPVEGVLMDVRDLQYAGTSDEASNLGTEFASFLGRRRLAFVTRSTVHYGMARMISRRAESRGVDVDLFADEDAALEWLHSPDTSHDRYETGFTGSPSDSPNDSVAGTSGRKKH
jgi:hypothetical protein